MEIFLSFFLKLQLIDYFLVCLALARARLLRLTLRSVLAMPIYAYTRKEAGSTEQRYIEFLYLHGGLLEYSCT